MHNERITQKKRKKKKAKNQKPGKRKKEKRQNQTSNEHNQSIDCRCVGIFINLIHSWMPVSLLRIRHDGRAGRTDRSYLHRTTEPPNHHYVVYKKKFPTSFNNLKGLKGWGPPYIDSLASFHRWKIFSDHFFSIDVVRREATMRLGRWF